MEYGQPVVETCRDGTGRAFYKYSEHPIDPITGLVDVGIKHGRYIENYHGERGIRYFQNLQMGQFVGMNWEFHEPDDNREDGGNHPKTLTSIEENGKLEIEFFVSGNIRSERFYPSSKSNHGEYSKSYSNAGFITSHTWIDGKHKIHVEFKTGQPEKMFIYDLDERHGWELRWHKTHLVHVEHRMMHSWGTSFDGGPHGLLLKYDKKTKKHILSFFDDDENVTKEVVSQCMDPRKIDLAEETMMTMYFDQYFRTKIPDHALNAVNKLIEQDKILIV